MNVVNNVGTFETDEGIEVVGTLSHKNLMPPGLLEEVKARPKGSREVTVIGAIIGRVRGLSMRSNAYSDEPSLAFIGIFDGMPAHIPGAKIRSQACFLPRLINNTLAAAVQGDNKLPLDKAPKKGQKLDVWGLNEINFAVEIGVVHDDSEVGFLYKVKQYGPDAFLLSDPLEAVRPLIPSAALRAPRLTTRMGMGEVEPTARPPEELTSEPRKGRAKPGDGARALAAKAEAAKRIRKGARA